MKSRRFYIKLFVTVSTLIWFFSKVRFKPLLDALVHVNWMIFAAAFFVLSIWVIPSAARWRRMARSSGYLFDPGTSIRFYIIGSFFNAFLPTGNGGDVVRGYLASKEYGYPLGAMWGIIMVERVIGLVVSLGLIIVSGLLFFSKIIQLKTILFSSCILLAGLIAGWVFLSSVKVQSLIKPIMQKVTHRSFLKEASGIIRAIKTCRYDPWMMASSVFYTLSNQAIQILGGFIISLAILDFNAPFYIFLIVIPLSFVSVLLPSIGGYGVREAGFVVFFSWFGIRYELAACFGVLRLLHLWCFTLAGGVLYLFGKKEQERLKTGNPVSMKDIGMG
jgi:glycosyltransferase 2 family protein